MLRASASLLAALALAASAAPARDQDVLVEMRRRRVIKADQARWTPDDQTLLLRMREAEKLGAFEVLRDRLAHLKTLAVEQPVQFGYKKLWLTKEGYVMFLFVKSQNARAYFESRGHEAKDVLLSVRNLREERLFDKGGTLTQAGDEVYNRVQRGLPAFWRGKDGRINGNVRPPKDGALPAGETGPAAPSPQSPQDAQALIKVASLVNTGYIEITEGEARHLMEATRRSLAELGRESSLQAIATAAKTFYLLSPSDPLMAVVSRYRAGDRTVTRPPGGKP